MSDVLVKSKKQLGFNSAYHSALSIFSNSYNKKEIFNNRNVLLASYEPLSIPALPEKARKEVILSYVDRGKILDITGSGTLSWALLNLIEDFNEREKDLFIIYFGKVEEFFDSLMNEDGLIETDGQGSWLGEARQGVLVENQAFYAKILDLMFILSGDEMYSFKKKRLIRTVRSHLDGAYVLDRKDSLEARPSNYIAAFFAPELFRREDWEKTFDAFLSERELWISWGGLRSLSATSPGFDLDSDGKSWFFINNMAAIVLSRLDSDKYSEYIQKILNASSKNIVWQTHAGRACEITVNGKIKVESFLGLSLATYIYLYRIVDN